MSTIAIKSNPKLWEEVKNKVIRGSKGGPPGKSSARKMQIAVAEYKARGGGYKGKKSPRNSLVKWTKEKWRTKSGKPSTQGPKATGERYLPTKAIKSLSAKEYAATSAAKRKGTKAGKQFVKQPKTVAKKTAKYRE